MKSSTHAATLALIAFLTCASGSARAQDASAGKKSYEAYLCYSCHGFNGETGARVLVPSQSRNLASEVAFVAFLRARANLAPNSPSTSMPNYSAASLSDAKAKDIYAYIRSLKASAPPVDDIPVFKQILSDSRRPYKP